MLSQATASAHSPQTKLQLMLDFHFMFSTDSIFAKKWSGVTMIISYWYMIEWWIFEYRLCSKYKAMIFLIFSKPHSDFADFLPWF